MTVIKSVQWLYECIFATYIAIFDLVFVLIEARRVLSDVLLLGQARDIYFALVIFLRLRETIAVSCLLGR